MAHRNRWMVDRSSKWWIFYSYVKLPEGNIPWPFSGLKDEFPLEHDDFQGLCQFTKGNWS